MGSEDLIDILLKERDLLQALINANPDLLIWLDDDGNIIEYKSGVPDEQYVQNKELLGKSIFDEFIGVETQKFKDAIENVRKTGLPATIEYSVMLEGVENFFEARITPIKPILNERFFVIIRNVTFAKREQKFQKQLNKILEDIIDFLPDATFVVNKERRVIAWNRAIEAMTGVKKEDIIGKGDYAYSIPFYGERRPILIDLLFEEKPEIEKRYDFVKKIGDIFFVETFVPGVYNGKGGYL
ncbi:MAG: PAS domain-containing protein, partial [Syntrophorhabdaceae bacterium]|nr:PAS domain-containing protein [Syntrophorhabdaceae bacterium]